MTFICSNLGEPLKRSVLRYVMNSRMICTRHVLYTVALLVFVSGSVASQGRSDIRKIDFRNFTFDAFKNTVTLTDGTHRDGDAVSWYLYTLAEVRYIDLDRDGKKEALVVVDFRTSGTLDNGKDYFVFAFRKGKLRMMFHEWREKPRWFGIKDRTIVITAPFWKDGGLCCPAGLETSKYRWYSDRFVLISRRRQFKDPNTNWWLSRRAEQALGADSP